MAVAELIAGYPQETRQIEKPNCLAIRQINESFHPELGERATNSFERCAQMIRNISPRKQKRERQRSFRVVRQVMPDAQEKPRNSSHTALLAHGDDKRQRLCKHLMGAAGFARLADARSGRALHPAVGYCLGRYSLTR
jgi:hypothetical protein